MSLASLSRLAQAITPNTTAMRAVTPSHLANTQKAVQRIQKIETFYQKKAATPTATAKKSTTSDINTLTGWDLIPAAISPLGAIYTIGEALGSGQTTQQKTTLSATGTTEQIKDIMTGVATTPSGTVTPAADSSGGILGGGLYEKALIAIALIGGMWIAGKFLGRGK